MTEMELDDLVSRFVESDDAGEITSAIGSIGTDELRALVWTQAGHRLVTEIVKRIPNYLDRDRADQVEAVVHWNLEDKQGLHRRFQVVIDRGTCRSSDVQEGGARVTFTAEPAAFLELVTGSLSATAALLRRRMALRGDVRFAMLYERLFPITPAS